MSKFNEAFENSPYTVTELAWWFHMSAEQLQRIMDGEAKFSDRQKKKAHHFIMKYTGYCFEV